MQPRRVEPATIVPTTRPIVATCASLHCTVAIKHRQTMQALAIKSFVPAIRGVAASKAPAKIAPLQAHQSYQVDVRDTLVINNHEKTARGRMDGVSCLVSAWVKIPWVNSRATQPLSNAFLESPAWPFSLAAPTVHVSFPYHRPGDHGMTTSRRPHGLSTPSRITTSQMTSQSTSHRNCFLDRSLLARMSRRIAP